MSEKDLLIPEGAFVDRKGVDKGWAWMVLLGSSLCHFIFIGLSSGVGIFYVEIQRFLNVDIVDVSMVGAFLNFCIYFGIGITSPSTNVIGCRTMAILGSLITCVSFLVCSLWTSLYNLYVFLGIIPGIGIALTYSSSVMVVNNYFHHRRSFGLVVILVAGGFGIISFSPFQTFLLDNYDLKGVFLINAAISLHMVVGAMLYFPNYRNSKTVDKVDSKVDGKYGGLAVYMDTTLWKNPLFYLTFTSSFLVGMGTYIPFTLLPDHMISRGVSGSTAALSVSAIGVTTTVSRIILAGLTNNFPRLNRWIYFFSGIFCGVLLFIIPFCQLEYHYVVVTAAYGLPYGVVSCLMPVLLVELFGARRLPACFGINNLTIGVASLIGSPFAGVLATRLQWGGIEFIFAGLAFTLCGLVMIPVIYTRTRPDRRIQSRDSRKQGKSSASSFTNNLIKYDI